MLIMFLIGSIIDVKLQGNAYFHAQDFVAICTY